MNQYENKILLSSHLLNSENKINSTKTLLEDSINNISNSNIRNQYNMSNINKKFNNTQYLLNDRTSILGENTITKDNLLKVSPNKKGKDFSEHEGKIQELILDDSLNFEISDNKILRKENKFDNRLNTDGYDLSSKDLGGIDHSIVSISDDSMLKEQKRADYINVDPVISLDKDVINFGICFPGETVKQIIK